jgi:predicted acetyltransferase
VAGVLLRPPELADEAEARAAQAELRADHFEFLLGLAADEAWANYVERVSGWPEGRELEPGRVPSTFLFAHVEGNLVGRASVRHWLNPWLQRWGGHIGYAVRPAFRRRGYATGILRQSLAVARGVGVDRALVVCDVGNAGSAAVIERCGGVLEDIVDGEPGEPPKRRYWVSTAAAGTCK